MSPHNQAAYITASGAHPLKVDSAPYPAAGEGEIVVKVAAVAMNPVDWMIQKKGAEIFDFLKYPFLGGSDMAGTVVEVGADVTTFKVGDRVLGLADCLRPMFGSFQNYVCLPTVLACPIPDDLEFTEAVVLPLGLYASTAALFHEDYLALDRPSLTPKPNGKTLLIWAGASSVGSCSIQLAVAAGYEVYTTSSPKNFDYCKNLGASRVFDYKSSTIVQDLIEAFKGKTCAGAYAICPGTESPVCEVVAQSEGRKFVACSNRVSASISAGVEAKFVYNTSLMANVPGLWLFSDYLPAALAQKKFQCLPKPRIVGHGLEHIQGALDFGSAGGLSAEKLVVTL
eukprot:Gregarina_sp_Pseudo_9__66@NODE_1044_length_1940_cov_265_916886_g978_i0_p1_GENE_NODE_1044_length_1940_cov_265_916886_g978_i0NODE_1044_length_1940_cov_265_916886_g978_i0_p1_ORF_typecomplete_len340_score36_41ADH_N/PF08240_12/2_7e15ADH_zinc_N/PF00107_26/5_9e09ADH_N_2/PF16884_5/0_068Bac_luciferase/PF00296_20/0_15_NODE_1044_length_1940_cov_265_916886_g978_i01251144